MAVITADTAPISGAALKGFTRGTDRLIEPSETLARVMPHLARIGITRIANVTGLDCIGIPVVSVCRPGSRGLVVSQGKGVTLDAARASGVMESVEWFHAERIQLPLLLRSVEEMWGRIPLCDIDRLPRMERSHFHPARPLLWVEGVDLIAREPRWVPFEMVHTNYTTSMQGLAGSFVASTNGLASGNHVLEAASHAICEVVERDATTLWRLRHSAHAGSGRIDPTSIDDPACCRVLELYERAGVAVGIWDATSDIGIATFVCWIADASGDPARALYAATGMGCHPRREVALLRALTEAAQSRLTAISGAREDILRRDYERLADPALVEAQRAALRASPARRSFRHAPTWDAETFDEDVAWELARLQLAGIRQVIAVDLTGPLGIPVVRVVIPGLEGSDRTPGYLYGPRARALMGAKA